MRNGTSFRCMLVTVGSAVALALPSTASAATREVATTGADTGNCVASPCLTLGYAVGQAIPEDQVLVRQGTYLLSSTLTIDKKLTIRGDTANPRPNIRITAGGINVLLDAPGAKGSTLDHLRIEIEQADAAFAQAALLTEVAATFDNLQIYTGGAGGAPGGPRPFQSVVQSPETGTVVLKNSSISTISSNLGFDFGAVSAAAGLLQIRNVDVTSTHASGPAVSARGGFTPAGTIDAIGLTVTEGAGPCMVLLSSTASSIAGSSITKTGPGEHCVQIGSGGNTITDSTIVSATIAIMAAGDDITLTNVNASGGPVGLLLSIPFCTPPPCISPGPQNFTVRRGTYRGTTAGISGRGTGTLSDLVARGASPALGWKGIQIDGTSATDIKLRNVTAIGHGGATALSVTSANGTIPAVDVKSSILRSLTGPTDVDAGVSTNVTVSHSNFATATGIVAGASNQSASPVFVDAAANNFHQQPGSPTVNSGTTDAFSGSVDFDGQPRVDPPAADIGADELILEAVPPETTIVTSPPDFTNNPVGTFTFSANEPVLRFECKLDSAPVFTTCSVPASGHVTPSLQEGSHTLLVRAVDAAGNVDPDPASRTWTVDNSPPDTSFQVPPPARTNQQSVAITFGSTQTGSTFRCRLDDAPQFAACSNPYQTPALGEGSHTIEVKATDPAGNEDSTAASVMWIVDVTPPDTTITSGPTGSIAPSEATFAFTSTEPSSTFRCKLDTEAESDCTSPFRRGGLALGAHTFTVYAIDRAGNRDDQPATVTFTVVAGPPVTAPPPPPPPPPAPPPSGTPTCSVGKSKGSEKPSDLRKAVVKLVLRCTARVAGALTVTVSLNAANAKKLGLRTTKFRGITAPISQTTRTVSVRVPAGVRAAARRKRPRRLTLTVTMRIKPRTGRTRDVVKFVTLIK